MIHILGGVHCDEKLYKRIIGLLKEINPDLVCLEELTHDDAVIKAGNDYVSGSIDVAEFKELTKFEDYWFDFSPYEELFSYLRKNKIKIYPIDHKLEDRINLIHLEKKILEEAEKNKDVSDLRKEEEKISVLDREKEMTRNITKGVRVYNSKKTCVIVGINHAKSLKKSLSLSNFEIKTQNVSSKKDVDSYIDKMYRYAKLNQVETLKTPPLVPIFASVFKKTEKIIE